MPNRRDDRADEKPRRCLRCQELFLSKNAGNRICPGCTGKPVAAVGLRFVSPTALDSIERKEDE